MSPNLETAEPALQVRPALSAAPAPAPALRREVFGFLPWWQMGESDLRLDYGALSTIAIFGVEADRNGNLVTRTSSGRLTTGWAAWQSSRATAIIASAHRAGTRVVLTVERFAWTPHQEGETIALLSSATARTRLATAIATALVKRGADGVNLDFEPVPVAVRAEYVAFVREVRAKLNARQRGLELTFDATRQLWLEGYDLPALTAPGAADAVFLMGYDYSGRDASRSGASAPIERTAGSLGPLPTDEDDDLTRTIEAYLEQVPPDKVILGLPWYGRSWSVATDTFPALTLAPPSVYGSSSVWTYSSAVATLVRYGKRTAIGESTAWTAYRTRACPTCPVVWRELVIDDARSFGAKLDLADRYALRGAGIWALGFDGSHGELRAAVRAHYVPRAGPDTSPPVGSVRILGGATWAPSSTVRVDVLALDNLGGRGVVSVAVSNTISMPLHVTR